MALLEFFGFKKKDRPEAIPPKQIQAVAPREVTNQSENAAIQAWAGDASFGYSGTSRVYWRPYDGEKSLGGIGPINKYLLDHESLRLRSWQLLLESEVVQIGIQRSVMWLIGDGLKLRCEPDKDVLSSYGIDIDTQRMSKQAESLFRLWSNNNISDSASMISFQTMMYEAEINAMVGGDCLFIINVIDGLPVVRLVDGSHINTPMFSATFEGFDMVNPDTGNRIRHGIEFDEKGKHVAFFVRKGNNYAVSLTDALSYERIPAADEATGFTRAFMYYGLRYRLDDIRGIPLLSVCMETTKQLELYKEATVTGAVERAKIAIVTEHDLGAIGTNPFESNMLNATGGFMSDIPKTSTGQPVNDQVVSTTGRQAINAAPGTKVKALDSKQEIHFDDFYTPNLKILFAAIGIPMEVALMLFGSNYSASRASIKDWEHTLKVRRNVKVKPAYRNVYHMFFLCQVLKNKISAPGFIKACGIGGEKDEMVKLAYLNFTLKGDNPPNIDELMEVKAARLKLGIGSTHLPLSTFEEEIDNLGGESDYRHVAEQFSDEFAFGTDECGIEQVELNKDITKTAETEVSEPKQEKPKSKPKSKKKKD